MAARTLQTVETSHGRLYPRTPRKDRLPKTPAAEAAAPHKDPATGRWLPGNPGSRLRQLAAIGRQEAESLLRLPVETVAPWLRAHLERAQRHAQELVDALPAHTAELVALCGDEAKARLMAAAALTEGAREDCPPPVAREWREEARAWMREVRQIVLTRKGLMRDVEPADTGDPHEELRRIHEAERRERERRQLAAKTTEASTEAKGEPQ